MFVTCGNWTFRTIDHSYHLLRATAGTAIARLSHRNSVCLSGSLSVRHTGGSGKNGETKLGEIVVDNAPFSACRYPSSVREIFAIEVKFFEIAPKFGRVLPSQILAILELPPNAL